MNKKEKKAVENIKALKILFEIDDKKDFEATPSVQKEMAKDLKTLLNLIDKMKNCINILDDELKERNKAINKKETIIEKLQKENEELENDNKYLRERESYLEKRREDIINLFQNQQTNTTIPIQKIKNKIETLKKTNVNGEIFTTAVNFAILTLQELIEEREEK